MVSQSTARYVLALLQKAHLQKEIYKSFSNKIVKNVSTFLGCSLANSWASKYSSSSVGTPSLNLRSGKANYTILLKINIKVKKSLGSPCSNASSS